MRFLVMLYGDEGAGETPVRMTPEQASAWGSHGRSAREQGVRDESDKIRTSLTRHRGGDFDLAEHAIQEVFATALEHWPRAGRPENPAAWVTPAARRRALRTGIDLAALTPLPVRRAFLAE